MKKIMHYIILTIAMGQLAACQTLTAPPPQKKSNNIGQRANIALEKAAIESTHKGSATDVLLTLEKKYKRNSTKPAYALAYARGLRKNNYIQHATLILMPFLTGANTFPGVKTEMSALKLRQNHYDLAEKYAEDALLQNENDYEAYQNLGLALDGKEMHTEAERAFRLALEKWHGNPTTIMNNLALNLAAQGFLDEAIEILTRAQAISPTRIEIERNLRIIRTLNEK